MADQDECWECGKPLVKPICKPCAEERVLAYEARDWARRQVLLGLLPESAVEHFERFATYIEDGGREDERRDALRARGTSRRGKVATNLK